VSVKLLLLLLLAGVVAWFAPAPLSQAHGSIDINASRDHVWSVLADLSSPRLWDPALKDVKIVTDNQSGPGAVRESAGAVVKTRETVTDWVAYNKMVLAVELQPKVTRFETSTIDLSPAGAATHVDWTLDYQMNGGYLGFLADKTLFGSLHQGRIDQALVNLKRYAETGEPAF
jgi:uncharacterized membrane protein